MLRQLESALQNAGIDVAREKRRRALDLHTAEAAYTPGGQFQSESMISMLQQSITQAVKLGFSGFRTAGDLRWAAGGRCSCDQMVEYEQMVEELFPQRPAIGLCQYPLDCFDPETLQRVLEAHRMALTETMAGSNHSSLYVRHGQFAADVVADRLDPSSRYYYVVQPHRGTEIVGWGVEHTFELAMQASQRLTAEMDAHHRKLNDSARFTN
jgi:MEDS: MEthanogen/methylotroph, DcmR Sensory domain